MRLTPPPLALLAAAAAAGACKRKNPPPAPAAPAPPNVVGPAGTTPTQIDNPSGPQVQISGANAGQSSIRSVPPAPATGCPAREANAALGPGTVHNREITQNETWTLEGSPHRLPEGAQIHSGVTVTIAPCAVVLVGHDYALEVQDGGALMAVGDAQRPVRIGSDNPSPQPGDWRGIEFAERARVTSRLAWAVVEHGGGGGGEGGCVRSAMAGLDLQNVSLQACRGYGVALEGSGGFGPGAADVTVTGTVAGDTNHSGAVLFNDPDMVRTLPAGRYTGNAVDEIGVRYGHGNDHIRTTGTWRNAGVRYHIHDDLDLHVEGPTSPVLTLAPGAVLAFGRDAALMVGWGAEGALVADGQAEATRIVFTTAGSDTSPGAWEGVYLGERFNRARTRLDFVTIQYAGAGSHSLCDWEGGGDAALLFIQAPPTRQTLTHVRFVGVPEDGAAIGRNWNGAPIDFAEAALGNDFSQAGAACHQSPLRDSRGNCPDPGRCQ